MVGLLFYFVPNAKVRFKDVWLGAIVTGVLWRLAFLGFSWYVRDLSRFSIHGSIAAVIVFLVWIYVCSVILLYGVEFTVSYARLRRLIPDDVTPPVEPASAPERLDCHHANQTHRPITNAATAIDSMACERTEPADEPSA